MKTALREAMDATWIVAIPASFLVSCLGFGLWSIRSDAPSSTIYILTGTCWAALACCALVYRPKRFVDQRAWPAGGDYWEPPSHLYIGGRTDLGIVVQENESDGVWEADLFGLALLLPGRPELGWIQALGSFQGEAIANLWLAVNAAQSGYVGPKGMRFGPGWRIRSRFDYTEEDLRNDTYTVEEMKHPDLPDFNLPGELK